MDLFDLNVFASTVIGMPIFITCALIYFVRRCPRWSGLFSVLGGMLFSVISQHGRMTGADGCFFCTLLDETAVADVMNTCSRWFGIECFNIHEPWPLQIQVFGMIFVCGAAYLFAGLSRSRECAEKQALTNAFYTKMDTPVDFEKEVGGNEDMRQLLIIGILSMIIGACIMILALFTRTYSEVLSCLGIGGLILFVGIVFHGLGLRSKHAQEGTSQRKDLSHPSDHCSSN